MADSREALEVFKQLDTDNNGSLTPQELSCRLSDLGFEEDEITELFTNLDTDGDGALPPSLSTTP